MMIRAYLRASTDNQDATRSKEELKDFVSKHDKRIASYHVENVSGTKTCRPELDKLIDSSEQGDILLIEKMDRLTRLPFQVWETLKARIKAKGLHIVVLDQPMTHDAINRSGSDSSVSAIQQALTNFMLDLGAAMARDDYETRMKRTAQGVAKAKAANRYKGRPVDENTAKRCTAVSLLVENGESVQAACKAQGVGRSTYYKWRKEQEG